MGRGYAAYFYTALNTRSGYSSTSVIRQRWTNRDRRYQTIQRLPVKSPIALICRGVYVQLHLAPSTNHV